MKHVASSAMKCSQAAPLLSPNLDGMLSGSEMQALQHHLEACQSCMRQHLELLQMQRLLADNRRLQPPTDLGLKLRLAISREAAQKRSPYQGLMTRIENTFHAFMVPATAGLVCAVLIFGLVIAILASPGPLQANDQDVPTMLNTGPELQQSVFGTTLSSMDADSLVIEAYVDKNGRVQDYRILSDPGKSQQLLPEVKRMLIFTTFRPAMLMGRPISSRAVLSFSRISVRG